VLFSQRDLDGIAAGTITLAFRRWDRARVRPGSRQRTPIGVIEVDAVEVVDEVTEDDARRAGRHSAAELYAGLRREGDLHRIELHLAGPDPRVALREREPSAEELEELHRRLDRMGPWARDYLRTIAERPGVRAADLAAGFGLETRALKARVRRLKELGLTESLRIGYRLSPRGRALLERL
jgi:hypothetical protein